MSDSILFRMRPVLATLVPKPFDKLGWVYEEKYDGSHWPFNSTVTSKKSTCASSPARSISGA